MSLDRDELLERAQHLERVFASCEEEAGTIVEAWDLVDDKRLIHLEYHRGRRDAYDAAVYWVRKLLLEDDHASE